MEKVIPPGLNYADIKPEAIENQIRIIKYTPISTIQEAQPNDVIRFHLQGNGFYDPYSAYLRVEVDFGDVNNPTDQNQGFSGKFLDRSAQALFNRLVIRSQGTELERIEDYDVVAAMINDMIYSSEQRILHHYEGFAQQTVAKMVHTPPQGNTIQKNAIQLPLLMNGAAQTLQTHYGDVGFWKLAIAADAAIAAVGGALTGQSLIDATSSQGFLANTVCDKTLPLGVHDNGHVFSIDEIIESNPTLFGTSAIRAGAPGYFTAAGGAFAGATANVVASPNRHVFCIPIYSGILGVLMPEKKFLPLSLLPLELELTVNPFAMYAAGQCTNRSFVVKKCEIFSHTLFFEQELHRSLEAVVAETGIFLHYNSFYQGPINQFIPVASSINGYKQIGVYLKSINALHWVYMYNSFESDVKSRKLHFVSHNMTSMQLRNGMDLIPSEPLQGQVGGSTSIYSRDNAVIGNSHSQFIIETYKAWNKMHDPLSDSAINSFNYQIDDAWVLADMTLEEYFKKMQRIGRCQYALTLEGEELGQQKSIITGKKSVMPFDLNLYGYKRENILSYMHLFIRADFIIYVRPDLVVTRLGL